MTARAPHVAEPPARYDLRPPKVVDCSAIAALVFRETTFESAARLLNDAALHAPHLIQLELVSVALKKHRRGEAHALAGLDLALSLELYLHSVDPAMVFALAERYQLSAYDAAYLSLAADLRCPLVTFDERLAAAAQTHLAQLSG
ncbi:MAG: type II toxin-antitoxin system VapC family toxin [Casimicrobiaceae bacterium]|nr:type II toxin-antitoxin system VapC family toxin [Casimicrobiaceae bacterium]